MKLSSEQNCETFVFEALHSSTGIGIFISWDKNLLNAKHQRNVQRSEVWTFKTLAAQKEHAALKSTQTLKRIIPPALILF